MDLDLNVEGLKDLEVVPAGVYPALVKDVKGEDNEGKVFEDKNGNRFLQFTFSITEGDWAGRSVKMTYVPLSGDSAWKTKQLCNALGMPAVVKNTNEFMGKPCTIKVANEMYKEQMQASVAAVLPPQ